MNAVLPPPTGAPVTASPSAPRPNRWRVLVTPLVRPRVYKRTLHLLLDLPVGIAIGVIGVTLVATGVGTIVTLVGIPLLMVTVVCGRWIGTFERLRASTLLEEPFPEPPPRRTADGAWDSVKAVLGDGVGWRAILYSTVMLVWGSITFTAAIVLWTVSLALFLYPTWAWTLFAFGDVGGWHPSVVVMVGHQILALFVGTLLLIATPYAIDAFAAVDRFLVQSLLSCSPEAALTARVEQLRVSRDASVEGSVAELRRIERDLHDGAQQRLVALAMDLGLAKERLARDADPARAAELVGRAHEEAKQAIVELRSLVRGIQPAVLAELGLDAALSSVVARSPVPVELDVRIGERPPAAIEGAAYFLVVEALANVAKHAGARRAWVRLRRDGTTLLVEVGDDGRGGAVEAPGGGLAGLRDRVLAVEGRLRITSPPDGPTALLAELPCGS